MYDSTYTEFRVLNLIEPESRTVATRGWEARGMENYCLMVNGVTFQLNKDEQALEMEGSDGCTTM